MGGDEVLEHAQTLAEVRRNRALDNFSRGFCHQSTHTGKLPHLLPVAARTGIDHQVNRIEFLTSLVVFEGAKHYAGNLIAGVRPDVEYLIVTLAVGDNAFAVWLLNLPDLFVIGFELRLFLFRIDAVRNPNRA